MPITFIPNDPRSKGGPPPRAQTPRAERPGTVAGFTYVPHSAAAQHPLGDPEFLFWQSREAALAAIQTFESLSGGKVRDWFGSSRKIDLLPDDGVDLNAYYDRGSVTFFHYTTSGKTTWSGASTDVVAHEVGHALLDQMRPELWDSAYTETGAFHEAFGDCMALLTAFADPVTLADVRRRMRKPNFVEATAEDLSAGVRRALGPQHAASKPRHARNKFQWALPSTLPPVGPPNLLTGEIHSFARVFTGCFYDLVLNILSNAAGSKAPTTAQLTAAVRTAGKLLIRAAAEAPETPRFFQSVGRAMVLADQAMNGGANRQAINDAFQKHNIPLASAAMLAPVAALGGTTTRTQAVSRTGLSKAAIMDLRKRLGAAPSEKVKVVAQEIGGQKVVRATHLKHVPLGQLDKRLEGVVAVAPQPVLVGAVDKSRAGAILGGVPEPVASEDEVKAFVTTLLETDRIAFDSKAARYGIAGKKRDARMRLPTHVIHKEGKEKVLRRVRFA